MPLQYPLLPYYLLLIGQVEDYGIGYSCTHTLEKVWNLKYRLFGSKYRWLIKGDKFKVPKSIHPKGYLFGYLNMVKVLKVLVLKG